MPSAATYTNYGLVKDLWPQKALYEGIFEGSPSLGLFKKDTTFAERVRYVSVGYGHSQGIAPTFGDAKQYKSADKSVAFQVQKRSIYGTFSIDGLLWRTYEYGKNKGILVDPLTRGGKNLMRGMKNRLSRLMWGNGVGSIGRLTAASNPASATVTLRNSEDLRNFQPDMPVQSESTGATGGTINGGVALVSSVGTYDTPTVTFTQAFNAAITGGAASDFLYAIGTYDAAPIIGFEGWNPDHSGAPGTFLSANRNVAPEWLAGVVLDARGKSPKQRIMMAARRVKDMGGKADTYFMSTVNFESLVFELGDKVINTKAPAAPIGKVKLGITYDGVEVMGPDGPIQVFPDAWMPNDVERCGQRDTCYFGSLGEFIHWDDGSSPSDLRVEDASDAREIRAVGDIAFINEFPAFWCRVRVA